LEVAQVEDCLEEEEVEMKRKKMEVTMEIQQKGMGTMKEEELGTKMVRWGCLLD
jgi:hypothetical protein